MWPNLSYFPVNWTDGMRISSKEFIAMENSLHNNMSDIRRLYLNDFCYGLLPSSNLEVDRYPKLKYSSNQSTITLLECRAITAGGHRIEIVENTHESINVPEQLPTIQTSEHDNGIFELFIKVNPYERVGSGRYSEDIPPRYKSVSPRYELSIRPKSDNRLTTTDDILKISEIELKDGRISVVLSESGNYIPPCISTNCHRRMLDAHHKFDLILESILTLIKSIRDTKARHIETSDDVRDLLIISERVALCFIGLMDYYRTILPSLSPAYLIVFFKGLAREISFVMDFHSFRGLEVQKEFERNGYFLKYKALLDTVINHSDIYPALACVDDYLEVVETSFNELNNREFRHVKISVEDRHKEPVKEIFQPVQPASLDSLRKEQKNTRRF